ncbi:hypothetical protein MN116_007486, partial [Schistosoma mekongi]
MESYTQGDYFHCWYTICQMCFNRVVRSVGRFIYYCFRNSQIECTFVSLATLYGLTFVVQETFNGNPI